MAPRDDQNEPDKDELAQRLNKELRLSETIAATILAVSNDAIISIDDDYTITMFNEGAEKIFGYTKAEMIGTSLDVLIPERLRAVHRQHVEEFADKKERSIRLEQGHRDILGLCKDGREFYADAAICKVDVDGRRIYAAALRDVTDRKEFERALENSNQELMDFAYIVSHDLKEPLRAISHFAGFLQEDYSDKLDQNGKEMLATLADSSQHMQELIDALLDYARMAQADLSFASTDLNQVIEETLELLGPAIDKNSVTVTVQENLPKVVCDSGRVGRIFSNLLINAIKYNESPHKQIKIGYTDSHPDAPRQIVFYVKDNGIGVPENRRKVIFQMFKRLHGREAYGGGTGSGLAIVKKIIDRHGGKIWVEPNGDIGSTFYFTFGTADKKSVASAAPG